MPRTQPVKRPPSFAFSSVDAEQIGATLSSAYAPVRIHARDDAKLDMRFECHVIGGVKVSTLESSAGIVFNWERPIDGYCLTMPTSGAWHSVVGGAAYQGGPRTGMMLDVSMIEHSASPDSVAAEFLVIEAGELHAGLAALIDAPVHKRLEFRPEVDLASSSLATVRALCGAVRVGLSADAPLDHAPASAASLGQALVNLVLEQLPHNYSDALRQPAALPAPRHIRRAIEFVHAHAAEPITVSDIAEAANTSVRSLQAGFVRFRNISPAAYLRQTRLAGARADLLAEGEAVTIAQVASRWGFAHPSVFADVYRKAFGERPSETLQRAATAATR